MRCGSSSGYGLKNQTEAYSMAISRSMDVFLKNIIVNETKAT